MEEESRISYEDMKGMVEAMSEVAGRLVPGMSLFYRENLLRRGSWDSFDSKEIAVAKTCSPGTAVRDALPGTCPEHVRNRNMQPEACPEPEHVRNMSGTGTCSRKHVRNRNMSGTRLPEFPRHDRAMEKIGEGRWARAANALLAELGPGWEAYSTYRSRLGLWKGAEVFCEGGTPSALLADFVRAAGRLRSAPAGVVRFFGVPEFLRCSSAEELLLKLEVRDGS